MRSTSGRHGIILLTGLIPEAKAVAQALGMPAPRPGRPACATVNGIDVELHVIGIAARDLGSVHIEATPAAVIMAGFGGALDPKLNIGDVVVQGLPSGCKLPASCTAGLIYTARHIVSTPGEKSGLFARTGASVVEMEHDRVVVWARESWGTAPAVVAVRSVSDRADQVLDSAVLELVDEWGRMRMLPLVRTLIQRPNLVPHLLRLGKDTRTAAASLGVAVRELIGLFAEKIRFESGTGNRIKQHPPF